MGTSQLGAFGENVAYAGLKMSYRMDGPLMEVRENVPYDVTQLLAEIGGNLGLLLGISALSIFDLMESLWLNRKVHALSPATISKS